MLNDALVAFLPIGSNFSLVGAAGGTFPSNVIDEIGAGVGTPPRNIIGTVTTYGADYGIGSRRPLVNITVGTAFTTGNAATLNIAYQGAQDTGAGGNYQPGTWATFMETGPIAVANLTAGAVVGRFDFEPAAPPNFLPRYLRLLFSTPAATNFTAGTIMSAIVTMGRDDQSNKYAAKNFTVS